MCTGGTPDPPSIPERQTIKTPTDPARDRANDDERRRRGMMATILTSTGGLPAPALSTNTGKEKLG